MTTPDQVPPIRVETRRQAILVSLLTFIGVLAPGMPIARDVLRWRTLPADVLGQEGVRIMIPPMPQPVVLALTLGDAPASVGRLEISYRNETLVFTSQQIWDALTKP